MQRKLNESLSTGKKVVANITDPNLANYKVAGGLTAALAVGELFDMVGLDSVASLLRMATIATGAGLAVNQYGLENSFKAAKAATGATMGLFGSITKSMTRPESHETVKPVPQEEPAPALSSPGH